MEDRQPADSYAIFSFIKNWGESVNHPFKKFVLIEMAAIGLPVLLVLVALFKGYVFLILLSVLLLAVSLVLSAMTITFTPPHIMALKHYVRAGLLIFCVIYLLFVVL